MTKLLFLNDEQKNVMISLLRDTMTKMVSLNFKNVAEDQDNIRYHAYLKGKQEVLNEILKDEFETPETEEQKAAKQTGDQS